MGEHRQDAPGERPAAATAGSREQRLDALLAAGGDRLALLDPTGRIVVANHPFAAALGRRPDAIEGRTLAEAGVPRAAAVVALVAAASASGATLRVAGLLPDGEVTLTAEPDVSGTGVVVVVRGSNPETEARVLRSRFLSTARHDLNQPLQAMQLFLHLLQMRATDPPIRDMVDRVIQALQGAESFVRVVLDVAALEAGLVRAERSPVAVDDVLAVLLDEFDAKAQARGLRLSVRPVGATVVTDQTLLLRLLRPLVDNAVRCTEAGGVLIGARRRGALLRLQVWDTGVGIPDADLSHLFDDFHQIEGRERVRGQGFGLPLVRRLAAVLGHPVSVRSRLGRGTVVSLDIPLGDAASA